MNHYRARIIEIAHSQVGKRGPYCDHGILWCGAFVCWVMREAGLPVVIWEDRPGERLCAWLNWANQPKAGDILRSNNAHCGIIVPDGIVCGGAGGADKVKLRAMWSGKAYDIDELIRVTEMRGAETGEVA